MNILTKFKELSIESLKDNKKLIISFYLIFIICFIGAWILSGPKIQTTMNNIPLSSPTGMDTTSAVELFIHNETGGIITYIGSIFFAIPAIILLLYNAFNLGFIGQLFSTIMPNGGIRYILYLIPHGIFEITATILQSVAGILLFLFILRFIRTLLSDKTQGLSDSYNLTKKVLIQSIILMIIGTILLLIAAPIEAYISIPISEFIMQSLKLA